MKYVVALLLCAGWWGRPLPAAAQQDSTLAFKAALLPAPNGALLVFTNQQQSFSIRVVSPNVEPMAEPGFMRVNGQILQAVILPAPLAPTQQQVGDERAKQLLIAYKEHESQYIRHDLKAPIRNELVSFLHLNNRLFMLWTYDMPATNKQIGQQQYLVSLCFNQALILNCPVERKASASASRQLLTTIGQTLKINNEASNLEQLYYQLNPTKKK
ncbi:hypothetical protein [Hymenobacter cheonanensis]|uniref:hypothetical protein n=1 Tax=Hymenobacter sp. CA2-7 TaxID=3063993 RepID=UPI00271220F2|nr:hypothetical protein [Hymenobacter sp. CA2-7]MDO7887575.1 hypothetical protein [Hymenobacter sp. CA2-7]